MKELEHENRLLEEELKTLQKSQSRKNVFNTDLPTQEASLTCDDRTRHQEDLRNSISSRNHSGQTS